MRQLAQQQPPHADHSNRNRMTLRRLCAPLVESWQVARALSRDRLASTANPHSRGAPGIRRGQEMRVEGVTALTDCLATIADHVGVDVYVVVFTEVWHCVSDSPSGCASFAASSERARRRAQGHARGSAGARVRLVLGPRRARSGTKLYRYVAHRNCKIIVCAH